MLTAKRTALLLSLSLLAACKTGAVSSEGRHWTIESVPQRMVKQFTGYRSDRDSSYIEYQYGKKKAINRTLRRHFAMNSAVDPFEPNDASQTSLRPAHSIAPDPMYYMHAESLFIGTAMLGISGGFVALPIDSIIGTISGNWGEFGRGFTGRGNAKTPPGVSKFKVKNR